MLKGMQSHDSISNQSPATQCKLRSAGSFMAYKMCHEKHLMVSSRKTVTNLWLPNILWHWLHNNLLSFQRAQDFRQSQKSCLRAEKHLQVWLFQTKQQVLHFNATFCMNPHRARLSAESSSNLQDFVWKNGPKSLEQSVRPVSPNKAS